MMESIRRPVGTDQSAARAVCRATGAYDRSRGVRFTTLAVHAARNAMIDLIRRETRIAGRRASLPENADDTNDWHPFATEPDSCDAVAEADLVEHVAAARERLAVEDPDAARIFVRRIDDGAMLAEIGAEFGCSKKAVRRRVLRTAAWLRWKISGSDRIGR